MLSVLNIGRTAEWLPVKVKENDRYKHFFCCGATGSGKSALLLNFIKQDSILKTAKVIIDPAGGLAKDAYSIAGGTYVSIDHPSISLNPLMYPFHEENLADIVIETLNQVVKSCTENVELTVRMRSILREAIVECVRNDRRRLDSVVDYIHNRMKGHAETRQGVIDRLNLLLADERMKELVCNAPAIDWKDFIDQKKTLVLDCHGLSRDKMVFIGTLATHGIKSYFRYSKETSKNSLILYIDECHNFISSNWLDILKEGRKYGISAVLATQDFSVVPETLKKAILSNCGTLLAFKVGYEEASAIAREFIETSPEDLQRLPKHHCAYRIPTGQGIAKTPVPPFVRKVPIEQPHREKRDLGLKWFSI